MNPLYNTYFGLPRPQFLGRLNKGADRIMAFMLKRVFDNATVKNLKKSTTYGLNKEKRDEHYIVSVTSFPGRINDVWVTIETLFMQSFKADMIILYLSEDQFPDKKLPPKLLEQQDRGLKIVYVPGDIRSHKKYYYAFRDYPESNIITVDDDVFYPEHTLKHLHDFHMKFPNAVVANRAHKMVFSGGAVKPYRQWAHNDKSIKSPSYLLVPTGVGGVLYPPGSYNNDIFTEEVFRKICFMADDLWLKIHTMRNNVKVVHTPFFTRDLITTGRTQDIKLVADNSHGGGNDKQLQDICNYYQVSLVDYEDRD